MASIYKITNTITNQIYIGKTTKTIEERFQRHIYMSKTTDTYLYRAMREYGTESFTIELVEEAPVDDISQRECYWIEALQAITPIGYNLTQGGTGGDTSRSPNYRAAILLRDMSGENNGMYGLRGEESPNYGSRRTAEQCANLKNGTKKAWDNDPDRKLKYSEARSGANNPMYGKKPKSSIIIIFNGIKYYSLADAARGTGRSPNFIKKNGEIVNE